MITESLADDDQAASKEQQNESTTAIAEGSAGSLVEQDNESDLVTMAELYNTPDYSLDDTTSFGYGGVPRGSVTNPQGQFIRIWSAVRRAAVNLADRTANWIKRRNKS